MSSPEGTDPGAVPHRASVGAVDAVAVLVLVALALFGLRTIYAGWGYLLVGLVAALAGLGLALATRRLPVAVLIAAVPVAGLLLAGPVALRTGGLGAGIPDLHLLGDVMRGSATGWGELLTTLPRVDLVGPPALVPFLLALFGAAAAAAMALRTRSAGGPVLPLLGVLVVVLLLRRTGSGPLDWFLVAFVAVAVVWVVVRGLGLAPEAGQVAGAAHGQGQRGIAAALGIAIALSAAVAVTAGNDAPGLTLRGRLGQLPDVAGLDSPLRRFRTFTEQRPGATENVADKLLFTVTGAPRGSRLRMVTLDRYDGEEWHAGNDTMPGTLDDRFLRIDSRVDNPTQGDEYRIEVAVSRAYRSAWIPTVGSLTSFEFTTVDRLARRSEVRYDLATSSAVLPVGLKPRNGYEFTAIVPDQRLTPSMKAWSGDVITVKGAERADPLLRRLVASPAEPMRKMFVLAKYLRDTGGYSDGALPGEQQYLAGHSSQRLFKGFLLAKRMVGNDEQYAAAMAVLANRVGVPARVVVGAVVPRNGKVWGADVQAWVEVRVADGSWRTLPTETFMSHRSPLAGMLGLPPSSITPDNPVVKTQTPTTAAKAASAKRADDRATDRRRSLLVRLLPWVLVLLLVLVVPLVKLVRRRLRRTRGRCSDQMAGAWLELVDHARDLGIPVRAHGTRPAQARVLTGALAGDVSGAGRLSEEGDAAVFAEQEPDEGAVIAYWEQVTRERRSLGVGRPLLRRLWAPFNPVTLVGRWRRD